MPVDPLAPRASAGPALVPRPQYRWYHKVTALLFILLCLETGFFLAIFPWTELWETNFFSGLVPEWHRYWMNPFFRGAVTGLGVVNLYISVLEIFRLRRFAAGPESEQEPG